MHFTFNDKKYNITHSLCLVTLLLKKLLCAALVFLHTYILGQH